MSRRVRAGVLIGGESRRMGTPKHELMWRGRRFLQHVEAAVADYVVDVVALGGAEGLADVPGHRGPNGGILAARRHDPDAIWLIVACDMPLVTPAAVAWLLSQWSDDVVAVMPVAADGREQPLLALYGPGSDALIEASTGPRALALADTVVTPGIPPELAGCWLNVNTPDDLQELP